MNEPAFEDSVQMVIKLLREAMGEKYTYFDGDPEEIGKSELPAISVEMVSDQTVAAGWSLDDITDTVLIKVILDKSADFSAQRSRLNMTHREIREAIGGRGKDGNYRPNTIKGALRTRLTTDQRIGADTDVDYGFLIRPGNIWTSEGHIRAQVKYTVTVPQEAQPQN